MAHLPRGFKYDIVLLLRCVRERPCIWDKTIENYKDKMERNNAWEEIFHILEEQYEAMSWEDKRVTRELIQNKWTNIRDTFVRSLKTKFGKPKKRYMYYDHVKFLLKCVREDDICFEYNEDQDEANNDTSVSFLKQEVEEPSTSYSVPVRKSKRKKNEDHVPKKSRKKSHDSEIEEDAVETGNDSYNFLEVDSKEGSDPRLMNEDEAFFASLLPTVVKYNEGERLEFRIEVLNVMKKIMVKRTWNGDADLN